MMNLYLALLITSGIRQTEVSSVVQGAAITLMVAGFLSMTFMGFAEMGK